MLTLLSAINLSSEYLQKKGVESPRANVEIMLAEILNCKRLDLYLNFNQPLNENETAKLREFIKRRGEREPLQYITGKCEFFGRDFIVNKNVLIPRPETEFLIETVLSYYNKSSRIDFLDIGTGSGNIAITILLEIPKAKAVAIDISSEAIKLAKVNAESLEVDQRIDFSMNDIKSQINFDKKFDLIVSNPPYVSSSDIESLEPELKFFEPRFALTDAEDGLSFYKLISEKRGELLKPGGRIIFELGKGQSESVRNILTKNNFSEISVVKDLAIIDRIITGVNK